jgi:hypothetical protein
MTKFTIKQIVVELDGGKLAAVVLNEERRTMLEYMLPALFEGEAIQVVALDNVKMVPLSALQEPSQ